MSKKVILCRPNGFCAGVERAVQIVDLALDVYGAPVYVNHEIVHNHHVVDALSAKGAVFLRDDGEVETVPEGALLIYSAHGVSPELRRMARDRKLRELDATCPLVTKVHMEALRFARQGYHIFLIGHADHVEVIGVLGETPEAITIVEPHRGQALERHVADLPEPPTDKLIYLTQTTLNVDDCLKVVAVLRRRFPSLAGPPSEDICYATSNRQNAVKETAQRVDFFIVVGAIISSNSKRLVEVAREAGCAAALFQNVDEVKRVDLAAYPRIGVTAGASTPASLVQAVLDHLADQGYGQAEPYDHVREDMHFNLPHQLRQDMLAQGMAV